MATMKRRGHAEAWVACAVASSLFSVAACAGSARTGYVDRAPPSGGAMKLERAYAMDSAAEFFNTEEYERREDNRFMDPLRNPLATFSIDVDKASYGNVRRFLEGGQLPPPDAVRIEELINYFPYPYPDPQGRHPFSVITEMAECPWNQGAALLLVGIQGKRLDYADLKPANLVLLLDTSGSMSDSNKLPLVKRSVSMLLESLTARDRVAIVAYAGSAGLVLDSTTADRRAEILSAMDKLSAGGSTAGAEGIQLAYRVAADNFIQGGNNRVILCTDGDFNVGVSSTSELTRLMDEKRRQNIYLTICGFGMGNYKDGRMEAISKAGNGNYFYIDSPAEAEKVFVKEMRANLFTIAKDVKIQVEFNPAEVQAYRLIGYENRILAAEDFTDDTKDSGELGAGHSVTALFEILPKGYGQDSPAGTVEPLKYQAGASEAKAYPGELATVKFRYKPLGSEESVPLDTIVEAGIRPFAQASASLRWAAAVTEFGMLLRDSPFKGSSGWEDLIGIAKAAAGRDDEGYRAEFIGLAEKARALSRKAKNAQ